MEEAWKRSAELLEATARHDELAFKLIFHLAVAAWALSAWHRRDLGVSLPYECRPAGL